MLRDSSPITYPNSSGKPGAFVFLMAEFFVYILKSTSTGKFYIGQTQSLEERLKAHQEGNSTYTKNKGPWTLMAYQVCHSRSEAVVLERKLKNFKSRERLEKWITDMNGPVMPKHDEDPRNTCQS